MYKNCGGCEFNRTCYILKSVSGNDKYCEKLSKAKNTSKPNTRPCYVDGKLGYFHCWEHYADVIDASALVGGHPAGQVSRVYGIVEFSDGVKRVDPIKIIFADE